MQHCGSIGSRGPNGDGAGIARLFVNWRQTADGKPSNPRDPGDPSYDFSAIDGQVNDASAHGLEILITFGSAPAWAEGKGRPKKAVAGTWKPSPAAVGDFAAALARRYSGSYGGFPRVRDFQVFNEVNLDLYLSPQWSGGRPFAAEHYSKMLSAAYAGIHSVSQSDRVVTSGLAPYGDPRGGDRTRPLVFWRAAFCLKGRKQLKPKSCRGFAEPKFDVFAHHAINTSGAPTQSARHPDDASSGDLPAVVRILRAAERHGRAGGPKDANDGRQIAARGVVGMPCALGRGP